MFYFLWIHSGFEPETPGCKPSVLASYTNDPKMKVEKTGRSEQTDLNRNDCIANNCETISREVTLSFTTT